jgi:hypothetical protein
MLALSQNVDQDLSLFMHTALKEVSVSLPSVRRLTGSTTLDVSQRITGTRLTGQTVCIKLLPIARMAVG